MKLITATVSLHGFSDIRGNASRFDSLKKTIRCAKENHVGLVCLPGGYLHAKSQAHLKQLAADIVKEGKRNQVGVAVGIDLRKKQPTQNSITEIAMGRLPYFVVCWHPRQKGFHLWRQRSTTSSNQWATSNAACTEQRTLRFGNWYIETLICGEIFNQRIRDSVVSRTPPLNAVVDLGHTSEGFRVHAAMKVLARRGINTLCSVHADRYNAQKYCYASGMIKRSSRHPDFTFGDNPRLEVKVWDLASL